MFNLIATMLICLGVANTTPISNYKEEHVLTTPKKANVVNDYNLQMNIVNSQTITNNQYATNNELYPNGLATDTKYSIANNNNYINVIGNIYQTLTAATNNNVEIAYIAQNYENYQQEQPKCTRIGFMFKLTPYNYNINTELDITILLRVIPWTDQAIKNGYIQKEIFTTTQENWDTYINRQITTESAWRIREEITNLNNGFYYLYNEEIIDLNTNNTNENWNNTTTINIEPEKDNYIYICYTLLIEKRETDTSQNIITNSVIAYNQYPINITGTNIIPDGTYEVVDIPGLMFEVIGMPFAFVSQAFNLTLFPGTPYQINIANLFLSIVAIFVFVWLIMLFVKKGS